MCVYTLFLPDCLVCFWFPDPKFPFRLHVRPYKLTFNTLLSPAPKRQSQYNGLELLLSVCLRRAQRVEVKHRGLLYFAQRRG